VSRRRETSEAVWSARGTTPTDIEEALRTLLRERHARNQSFAPARVLNLVTIADREWQGEVTNRLERIGTNHPSRTIFCAVDPGRTTLDATVAVAAPDEADGGSIALGHEHIELEVGPSHLRHLDTIVDPLVVGDLATVIWAPHGHDEGVAALRKVGQVVLVDSVVAHSVDDAIARAHELCRDFHVVDLAWLRSTPWRERLAMSFDPERMRGELRTISAVTIRHHPESAVAGLLLIGWLASRLGWTPGTLVRRHDAMYCRARAPRQDVAVRLEPDETLALPGLAGITIETASGMSLALDRGPGGLRAVRHTRRGGDSTWVVMGASRGESGILGDGLREALLRDRTYRPALECVRRMLA
jgi:glucose-6-phosphate dehydrogenase assembly protein OpcA